MHNPPSLGYIEKGFQQILLCITQASYALPSLTTCYAKYAMDFEINAASTKYRVLDDFSQKVDSYCKSIIKRSEPNLWTDFDQTLNFALQHSFHS